MKKLLLIVAFLLFTSCSQIEQENPSTLYGLPHIAIEIRESDFTELLKDPAQPLELRVALMEALGWYTMSVNKAGIVETCKFIIESEPENVLVQEAIKTYARLTAFFKTVISGEML